MPEGRRLAPLYAPDPRDLDLEAHLSAAMDWLKRAQDAGDDRGVSYGVRFGSDFDVSYPETTGYICQTFVELWRRTGDEEYLTRAIEMGRWEADVQMEEGAVMGGKLNQNPTPAVFNTGMVLLGWSALARATGDEGFRTAATRACDWCAEARAGWQLDSRQLPVRARRSDHVQRESGGGAVRRRRRLRPGRVVLAAVRNAEFCLTRQQANGWFRDCCLDDPERPLLHTIAYTAQGLLEIGRMTGREDLIAAARRTADAESRVAGRGRISPRPTGRSISRRRELVLSHRVSADFRDLERVVRLNRRGLVPQGGTEDQPLPDGSSRHSQHRSEASRRASGIVAGLEALWAVVHSELGDQIPRRRVGGPPGTDSEADPREREHEYECKPMRQSEVLGKIEELLGEMAAAKGASKPRIRATTLLLGGGLPIDSLDLAGLVVELELATGLDPFKDGFVEFRTAGELADLYSREP